MAEVEELEELVGQCVDLGSTPTCRHKPLAGPDILVPEDSDCSKRAATEPPFPPPSLPSTPVPPRLAPPPALPSSLPSEPIRTPANASVPTAPSTKAPSTAATTGQAGLAVGRWFLLVVGQVLVSIAGM
jgi:hypothetical protein